MIIKTLLTLSYALFLSSCATTGSYLVNTLAKLGDYQKIANIQYSAENKLDIYIPDSATDKSKLPVVIFFYGGCWGACQSTYKGDYEFLADALTAKGYLVVIPDYRLYPAVKFDTIIADAAAATQWVKDNISKYKGDADSLFLMGHSAGAHMAIMLCVNEEYLEPTTYASIRGGIGLAGPYDFIPYTEPYLPGVFGPESEAAYAQPPNFIEGNEPPLLLMYGAKDDLVEPKSIINLSKAIEDKNGQVTAITYPELDHVSLITSFTRPLRKQDLVDEVDSFIKKQK